MPTAQSSHLQKDQRDHSLDGPDLLMAIDLVEQKDTSEHELVERSAAAVADSA